jgi:hypothetical protein
MELSGNSTSYSLVSRIGFWCLQPVGIPSPSLVRFSTHAVTSSPPRGRSTSFVRYSSSSSGVVPCISNAGPSFSLGSTLGSRTGYSMSFSSIMLSNAGSVMLLLFIEVSNFSILDFTYACFISASDMAHTDLRTSI